MDVHGAVQPHRAVGFAQLRQRALGVLSELAVTRRAVARVAQLLLENPTTIVAGDRVTHLLYDVKR